ncbi:MAG: segregation/condensation protein A [Firmicutes bacterium]|nr:segregation/condensation protein A [Bacillota bacterium]
MPAIDRLAKEFDAPPPPTLTIDERTNAYIEKLKLDITREFTGPMEVKIDDFDGSLDLLLFLVKQAKVSIEDIFISKITDQYLALIEGLENTDLDKASDFISIAAVLIEIKSKALLPKSEFEIDNTDNTKRELIQRLEEYKLFKEASEKMKAQEAVGFFYKAPDPTSLDEVEILKDMTPDGLIKALQKLFLRLEKKPVPSAPRSIIKDRFTIPQKMSHIRDIIEIHKQVIFSELFDEDYSKLEIITSFQALLELLKMQEIYVMQEETFSDIIVSKREAEDREEFDENEIIE